MSWEGRKNVVGVCMGENIVRPKKWCGAAGIMGGGLLCGKSLFGWRDVYGLVRVNES